LVEFPQPFLSLALLLQSPFRGSSLISEPGGFFGEGRMVLENGGREEINVLIVDCAVPVGRVM
jgi:hypothetical protein